MLTVLHALSASRANVILDVPMTQFKVLLSEKTGHEQKIEVDRLPLHFHSVKPT